MNSIEKKWFQKAPLQTSVTIGLAAALLAWINPGETSNAQSGSAATSGCDAVIDQYRPSRQFGGEFSVNTIEGKHGEKHLIHLLGKFLVTCEETKGKRIKVVEVNCAGDQANIRERIARNYKQLKDGDKVEYRDPIHVPDHPECIDDQAITVGENLLAETE